MIIKLDSETFGKTSYWLDTKQIERLMYDEITLEIRFKSGGSLVVECSPEQYAKILNDWVES